MSLISIVLGLVIGIPLMGLVYWHQRRNQTSNGLHSGDYGGGGDGSVGGGDGGGGDT